MPGSQSFSVDPRNERVLVSLNGQFMARHAAKVSIFDGGFVVGDGVWEGLRLPHCEAPWRRRIGSCSRHSRTP
jgi:branched-chain amino acid aminotransferase